MIRSSAGCAYALLWFALLLSPPAMGGEVPLEISVYATAGGVARFLNSPEGREKALSILRPLGITRIFLEGRRGDEYVSPEMLSTVRDFFAARGIRASGGIATVPGKSFGVRHDGKLGWLDWEKEKTRRDIAAFFTENAPIFEEIIVDDFFCTADTSAASEAAKGSRSWSEYRRDLLVSLIDPVMIGPARAARPGVRLIIKFPQWYDRFHLFGYDPPRMSGLFSQVWVGTEVRNPATQRMGFVQPTEGYMNFRWIRAVAGPKVVGAWFDHIDSTAQNFVDQAYQSVLAGARELTLFHLGDLMEGHPGDALLRDRLPELMKLASRLRDRKPSGVAYYKPPASDADENLYLMDYLGMIGLPIVPCDRYPADARVAILGVQAAADPRLTDRMERHLNAGATLVLTPALLRKAGAKAMQMAGVEVEMPGKPAATSEVRLGETSLPLPVPLDYDGAVRSAGSKVLVETRGVPLYTFRRHGRGAVIVLNVRTFNEQDFEDAGELLLAPKPRGLASIPQELADGIRGPILAPLGVRFEAPAGVGLYLFGKGGFVYSFLDRPADIARNGKRVSLPPHGLDSW